jgi:N-acetylmuramic acid 6-phosphate (MurNAc-6-P) etherase
MMATGSSYDEAAEVLKSAGNHVKTAIIMKKLGVSAIDAKQKLNDADGFVKRAII